MLYRGINTHLQIEKLPNFRRVLYFSIHRFEDGKHWPNLKGSNADYVGEGKGRGFNINVPLNRIGLGNADYLTIFHQILLPVAVEVSYALSNSTPFLLPMAVIIFLLYLLIVRTRINIDIGWLRRCPWMPGGICCK